MKNLFLPLIALLTSLAAAATDITTGNAGQLATMLGNNAATTTSLSVSGPVNASDLHFIASLPALSTLDLSRAKIVEEANARLATNTRTYQADHLPPYILAGGKFSTIKLPDGLVEIGDGALMSTSITSIAIPASVKRIGNGALADCRSLSSLTVPSTVTTLGSHLCDGATALKSVTFNASYIPAYAFRGCVALSGFEGSPVTIGDYAFAGCTALKSFPFPAGLSAAGTGAFYNSGLNAADLGSCRHLDTLGDYAFAGCEELVSVRLPEGLESIGEGAFFADRSLRALNIPTTVTTLDDFSLKGTGSLDSSTGLLSDGVSTIGRYALAGMESLKSVMIPAGLVSIDDYGMAGMTSLESIDARRPREVPETGARVWDGIDPSKVTLYVDPSMENSFLAAEQWNDFSIVTSGMESVEADSGSGAPSVNLSIDGTDLVITSSSSIDAVAVYDISGRRLAEACGHGKTSLDISLSGITPQVLIVTVTADSHMVSFKIAK
ncbi:MAG: leucine-rich repeat protein [Duncaniella sp.]|nr:leucine-rich repeat protein [Duncaniella sp.]